MSTLDKAVLSHDDDDIIEVQWRRGVEKSLAMRSTRLAVGCLYLVISNQDTKQCMFMMPSTLLLKLMLIGLPHVPYSPLSSMVSWTLKMTILTRNISAGYDGWTTGTRAHHWHEYSISHSLSRSARLIDIAALELIETASCSLRSIIQRPYQFVFNDFMHNEMNSLLFSFQPLTPVYFKTCPPRICQQRAELNCI